MESDVRALLVDVLGFDPVQHLGAASAMVPSGAHQPVAALFIIAICVNIGMWLERYVIVVVSPVA